MPLSMAMRNRESNELANIEPGPPNYVSSIRKSGIYRKCCSYVTSVRSSRIYKSGVQILTALGNSKGGKLIKAILNVEEAGVYSESRTESFRIFFAQSSNYSYLSILIYGLMIPMPSLLALLLYSVPLQHPSAVVNENGMYFVVLLLVKGTVIGIAMAHNFKAFFPELKFGFASLMTIGITPKRNYFKKQSFGFILKDTIFLNLFY